MNGEFHVSVVCEVGFYGNLKKGGEERDAMCPPSPLARTLPRYTYMRNVVKSDISIPKTSPGANYVDYPRDAATYP